MPCPTLTTFSRELNGPTWGPTDERWDSTAIYAYAHQSVGQRKPRSTRGSPNPRVQTAAFTRNNKLTAVIGEPLVKYRFPLDKLALLEKFTGTGFRLAIPLPPMPLDILKYFGLDLATACRRRCHRAFFPPLDLCDDESRPTSTVGSSVTGIMTLDEVAQQNREPDFFELLQAGILSGSLGVPGQECHHRVIPIPGVTIKYPRRMATLMAPPPSTMPTWMWTT